MSEKCCHIIGLYSDYYDGMEIVKDYGHHNSAAFVDDRFNFCPLCGAKITWEGSEYSIEKTDSSNVKAQGMDADRKD